MNVEIFLKHVATRPNGLAEIDAEKVKRACSRLSSDAAIQAIMNAMFNAYHDGERKVSLTDIRRAARDIYGSESFKREAEMERAWVKFISRDPYLARECLRKAGKHIRLAIAEADEDPEICSRNSPRWKKECFAALAALAYFT